MDKTFSNSWKASKLPRKQRKYKFNAPDHIQAKFMRAPLSKDLRKKYEKRSIRIRKEDKVKILRGKFKGKEGKIESVNMTDQKITVEKIENYKKEGSKTSVPIHPSNIIIIELNDDDKKRMKKIVKKNVSTKGIVNQDSRNLLNNSKVKKKWNHT